MDDKSSETIVSVEDSDKTTSDAPSSGETPESQQQTVHEDVTKQNVSTLRGENTTGKDSTAQSSEEGQQVPPETRESNSTALASTPSTQNYVPPVKRFSSVNVNKKFLQKNHPTPSGSTVGGASASGSKQSGLLIRPSPQSLPSHSRLVTAKLTASSASTLPVPGWSRPNSVPPPAASPSNAPGLQNTPSTSGQPTPLHGAKLVQPQARSMLKLEGNSGSVKPAWRNLQPVVGTITAAQGEFPTAAEAVKGVSSKISDTQSASEMSEGHKQAMDESADAFRGVHLDPNAHHWDEMEEDNDDFLGGVIEFGDGRQYTIQVSNSMKAEGAMASEAPISKQERFPDDFDRSWPRSRPNINTSVHDGLGSRDDLERRSRTSETSSGHSPVLRHDGSRVLFNERSNRMEPYSNSRNAQAGSQVQPLRRPSADHPSGLTNGKLERDAPPHSTQAPFQVLQKSRDQITSPSDVNHPSHFGGSRRDHSVMESSIASQSPTESIFEHRKGRHETRHPEVAHATQMPNGRPLARSPSTARSAVNGMIPGDVYSSARPPEPQQDIVISTEADRQLPPHLQRAQDAHAYRNELPKAEAQDKSRSLIDSRHNATIDKRATPDVNDRPAQNAASETGPAQPAAADEALRKAFISDSVERARLRRQQEEEERAKASERARNKAEELAKLFVKSADAHKTDVSRSETAVSVVEVKSGHSQPTEAEVLTIIEEAVKQVMPPRAELSPKITLSRVEADGSTTKLISGGLPSTRDSERPATSAIGTSSQRPPLVPPANQKDSWRSRAQPSMPTASARKDTSGDPTQAALPAIQAFPLNADESMEVIDFSDIGRLVGQKPASATASGPLASQKSPRPVASDFLDIDLDKAKVDSWRRSDHVPERGQSGLTKSNRPSSGELIASEVKHESSANEVDAKAALPQVHLPPRPVLTSHDSTTGHHSHPHTPGSPGVSRVHRHVHREAPLSALDDTMSRIKGALDGMHNAHETKMEAGDSESLVVSLPQPAPAIPQKQNKWLPPARRPYGTDVSRKPQEASALNHLEAPKMFAVTHVELPSTPPPPNDNYSIRMGKCLHAFEPVSKKKLQLFERYYGMRWEILSFQPPVEGMSKKTLSVNDVLFRKPTGPYKFRRYNVLLPKKSRVPLPLYGTDMSSKTSIPAARISRDPSTGAFGRPRALDQSSWRVPSIASSVDVPIAQVQSGVLDVTSRSPPPDLVRIVKTEQVIPSCDHLNGSPSKTARGTRKSLDGNDVAFYRDLRKPSEDLSNGGNIPVVTFTVSSELEVESNRSQQEASIGPVEPLKDVSISISKAEVALTVSAVEVASAVASTISLPSQSDVVNQSVSPKGPEARLQEQAIGDSLLRKTVSTPPPPANPTPSVWRSPGRIYPDPEHLKAVWSQASDKESLPTTNSLKKFEDDLTAVPFTLQEVKSEGGTPPPAGLIAPPARMSASEVTKAFQTVPSGPSNHISTPTLRAGQASSTIGSPLAGHRTLKSGTINLPQSTLQPVLNPTAPRPHYVGYPAMTNHSPSPPTLMYSHVQNGLPSSPAGSPYGQPVWMPVVHQQGPQIIRAQPASPYSPSVMPYHVPGAPQNGVYPPQNGMPNTQGSHAAYANPGPMMVSPVMSQATAVPPHMMYASSPMLVPVASPSGPPQPRPFSNVTVGRPAIPVQPSMESRPSNAGQPHSSAPRFPGHSSGYQPVHAQPFARQW